MKAVTVGWIVSIECLKTWELTSLALCLLALSINCLPVSPFYSPLQSASGQMYVCSLSFPLLGRNEFTLLDIHRFWIGNTLIYLSSGSFIFNMIDNWWHNPGWKTINCNENVFQMFYFFVQQVFIWADCIGSKQ